MPSTVNNHVILGGTITLQRIGAWHADLDVDAESLTGQVTSLFEGVEYKGTVLRAGLHGGRLGARIVGGKGGISKDIGAKNYASSQGTKVSAVVADIMRETGETLSSTSEAAVLSYTLPKWERAAGPASHALVNVLDKAGGVWRVLSDGTIWVGLPSYPEAKVDHVLIDEDWVNGIFTIAAERADLQPGTTFRGQKIEEVIHRLSPEAFRTEAHVTSVSSSLNRFLGGIRRQIDMSRTYPGRVSKQNDDGTLQIVPDDEKVKGTGLDKAAYYVGLPGSKVKVNPGQRVLFLFEAGDGSRVSVVAWQGGGPKEVTIGGPTGIPAARQGDMVACGGPGTMIMFIGPPGPVTTMTPIPVSFGSVTSPPLPSQTPLYGLVTSGNPLIKE